ncbi:MAG: hypothetical protein Q9198_006772 [Flavoplaca austrocitrina]
MKAATYSGIMTSSTQSPALRYPTGNCTWPITTSLAVCGGCAQSTVQKFCRSTIEYRVYERICEVATTSGMKANLSEATQYVFGTGFQVFPSPGSKWKSNDTSKAYIANFEMVGYRVTSNSTDGYTVGMDIDDSTPVVATECALWFCVKSYKCAMVVGSPTESVTETFSAMLSMENDSWMDTPESFLDLPLTMNPRPGANFSITFLAKFALQNYLKTIFDGGIEVNTASQESSHTIAAMWPATRSIDAWIENLAASMTNVVRTTTPEPHEYYNGTAYQVAFRVRWIWITLPGILLLVSQLVLIGAMLQTKRSSVQAWKGSPLALLFVNTEDNLQRRLDGQASAYRGYEKALGKTVIGLEKEGHGGWVARKRL